MDAPLRVGNVLVLEATDLGPLRPQRELSRRGQVVEPVEIGRVLAGSAVAAGEHGYDPHDESGRFRSDGAQRALVRGGVKDAAVFVEEQ